tara:strand:+ start:1274 stop:1492 length:219 start_codon:yes stop_codon:yes gene_type:complete
MYVVSTILAIVVIFIWLDSHTEDHAQKEIYVGANLDTDKLLTREDLKETEWKNKLIDRIIELENKIEILEGD